jgi:hypothetical protein
MKTNSVKNYFSVYHCCSEVWTTWLEVLSFLGWVLFASGVAGEKSIPQPSILFFCIMMFVTILSMFLLYQSWFCKRVKNNQLVESNIWTNPAPAYFFLWMCLSPVVLVLISPIFSVSVNILSDTKSSLANGTFAFFIIIQLFAWLFWTQTVRNSTQK